MQSRFETVEVEADMLWTAAIMGSLAILETYGGDKFDYLQTLREEQGIGGDSMNAGFLRLAIAAGKYLNVRIKTYDHGVFSYEHLETDEGALPWLLVEQLTPDEWSQISDWKIPQERLQAIIDAWLEGPRFEANRADGSLDLNPLPSAELKTYRVELNGRIDMRYTIDVEAVDEESAEELAILRAPTEANLWEADSDNVGQIEADTIEEGTSA